MKPIILLFFISLASITKAANYYLSSQTGDDNRTSLQAQNPSTPWRTIIKLNAFGNLKPGDSVFLERGETFYGALIVNASGAPGNPIFYGSYGMGANPVISGQTELTSWTLHSGNIYYATLDVPVLHIVTLDNVVKGMGRYPNSGYLNYESHTANTSITDNQLSGAVNWSGGEVVIRKYRWIIDRNPITTHSANTLAYTATSSYGNNNAYNPVDGNGYFVQSHLGTLDAEGEWYYDNAANRFYMHFGNGTPSGKVVKVGTVDRLASINLQSHITFKNIDFEGGNYAGVLQGATNIIFETCNLRKQGCSSLYAINCNYITISGGSITDALNNGIFGELATHNFTIDGTAVTNIGTIAGMGRSGDAGGVGIFVAGTDVTIKNCTVTNIGYNGIQFSGDDVLVEKNFVSNFCTVKDDGGGIYTVNTDGSARLNRIIKNNIVINAIGAFAGVETYDYEAYGKAAGIYLDDFSNATTITNNVVATGEWAGIFLHNGFNNTVTNNLVYNFDRQQLYIIQYGPGTVTGLRITGNTFIAKTATQQTMNINLRQNDNPLSFGTIDSNRYARPIADNTTITLERLYPGGGSSNMTLNTWRSTYLHDARSSGSSVTALQPSDFRFEYNYSNSAKTVLLNRDYMDVYGIVHSGSITIPPYSAVVLIQGNFQVLPLNILNLTGKWVGKKISLDWETTNEINTHYFEIQKSFDENSYETIGKVSARKIQSSNYSFQDDGPIEGKIFYRLKIVALDGHFSYSRIIDFFKIEKLEIKVYPNPASDNFQIIVPKSESKKNLLLTISTVSGNIVKKMNMACVSPIEVDISALPRGLYIINLMADNLILSDKLLKR